MPGGADSAPGRPTRLAKKSDAPVGGVAAAAAAAAAAVAGPDAGIQVSNDSPGRPPRLVRKLEAESPATTSTPAIPEAAPAGRPQRLVKKSETVTESAPSQTLEPEQALPPSSAGRPPRLEKRSALEPLGAPATLSGGRPPRLEKKPPPPETSLQEGTPLEVSPTGSIAATDAPVAAPNPEAPVGSEAEPTRTAGQQVRLRKPSEEAPIRPARAKPAAPSQKAEVERPKGSERKFVARSKAKAELEQAPAPAPTPAPPPASSAPSEGETKDKLSALQTGKKKLRGIRINPDLE